MRKTIFLLLAAFSVSLIFLYSCRKTESVTAATEIVKPAFSVADAKKWYVNLLSGTTSPLAKAGHFKPLWEGAVNSEDETYFIVESQVQFDHTPGFVIHPDLEMADTNNIKGKTKLLVLKSKKNGHVQAVLMHIVSQNTSGSEINYRPKGTHFTGDIFFTDLEGTFINGWKYYNGRVTEKSTAAAPKQTNNEVVGFAKPEDGDGCHRDEIRYYEQTCYYYTDGSQAFCSGWEYITSMFTTYCPTGGDPTDGAVQEIYQTNEVYSNQSIIDSLLGYPCAQNILKNLPDLNDFTDSMLNVVFGLNDDVDLKFRVSTRLTSSSQPNGETNHLGIVNGIHQLQIELNPWVLEHASQDFIARLMMHEGIHAMIQYEYEKYSSGLIDSTTFKSLYPLVWQYSRGNLALAEHIQISEAYVSSMAHALRSFNPALDIWKSTALAWAGLQDTGAYQALQDLNDVTDFNYMAKFGSAIDYETNGLKKCN